MLDMTYIHPLCTRSQKRLSKLGNDDSILRNLRICNALQASKTIAQCPVKNQCKINRCVDGGGGLKMGMGTVSVESKGALEDYEKNT